MAYTARQTTEKYSKRLLMVQRPNTSAGMILVLGWRWRAACARGSTALQPAGQDGVPHHKLRMYSFTSLLHSLLVNWSILRVRSIISTYIAMVQWGGYEGTKQVIIVSVFLALSFVVLSLRLFTRVIVTRNYGLEDLVITAAFVSQPTTWITREDSDTSAVFLSSPSSARGSW